MRPASSIENEASNYRCNIEIEYNGLVANAKSVISIVMLVLEHEAKIVLRTNGDDEDEALDAIKNLIESGFGED